MEKHRTYYPKYLGCNPIHEVRDWSYVRKLVRAAHRGESIPPILIDGEIGNCNLLAGTHRAAANDIMVLLGDVANLIPYIYLEDLDESTQSRIYQAVEANEYSMIEDILNEEEN